MPASPTVVPGQQPAEPRPNPTGRQPWAELKLEMESASTSTTWGCEGPSQACSVAYKAREMGRSPAPLPGAPSHCHEPWRLPPVSRSSMLALSGAYNGMGRGVPLS